MVQITGQAGSTMHRRKIEGEYGPITDSVHMIINLNAKATSLHKPWVMEAGIHLQNDRGQEQFVRLKHEALMNLHNALNKMGEAVPLLPASENTIRGEFPDNRPFLFDKEPPKPQKRVEIIRRENFIDWHYEGETQQYTSSIQEWNLHQLQEKLLESGVDEKLLLKFKQAVQDECAEHWS